MDRTSACASRRVRTPRVRARRIRTHFTRLHQTLITFHIHQPTNMAAASLCKRAVFALSRNVAQNSYVALRAASTSSITDMAEDGYEFPDSAPQLPPRRPKTGDVVSNIVDAVEADKAANTDNLRHTLAVLVDNESGVLSKVSGMLSARGFNIDSLTVCPTNLPDLSRMTIVLKDVPASGAAQALKQLADIPTVWAVVDYTHTNCLQRELCMVKVSYMPNTGNFSKDAAINVRPTYRELLSAQAHRASVRELGNLFGAEVVDVGNRHIVFQLTAWPRRVDAFLRMLEPWGIIETARSGVVAMLRSPVSGTYSDRIQTPKEATVDASQLPPG